MVRNLNARIALASDVGPDVVLRHMSCRRKAVPVIGCGVP